MGQRRQAGLCRVQPDPQGDGRAAGASDLRMAVSVVLVVVGASAALVVILLVVPFFLLGLVHEVFRGLTQILERARVAAPAAGPTDGDDHGLVVAVDPAVASGEVIEPDRELARRGYTKRKRLLELLEITPVAAEVRDDGPSLTGEPPRNGGPGPGRSGCR